ncbi:ribbon-helix-helix domain-containing protein [Rhizobium mayense]|uniref:Ribbon-helix-helix domain-containing protein n=1 Tax=Rhizobium mayense TaxID=1312184 RepID=A0ABT7JY66_9HYPH|nr:ribbon-helix-helix domain-containing protein [Rhizobium mayense]MDL2401292.1 ribbon-helix-helix domain-containing protein [Rhizobium mayense]
MTNFPISVSSRRMGRPPLKVKPTLVRLPEGMAERIDALVGKNNRADFIRTAVEKELERIEREAEEPSES